MAATTEAPQTRGQMLKMEALSSSRKLPEGTTSTGIRRVTSASSDKLTKALPTLVIHNHCKHTAAGTAPNTDSSTEHHHTGLSSHLPGTRQSRVFIVPEAVSHETATK